MKVVILAGGLGTRFSEESYLKPKPMIEIGDKPILWHIMKIYSYYGYNEFIICLGYKGYKIKEYFADYYLYSSDVTFDFSEKNQVTIHNNVSEPWKVTLVDTGLETMTGGRIKKIQKYVENETFMLTYGDGVSNINIKELELHHSNVSELVTVTAVQPGGRFGVININNNTNNVESFIEKGIEDGGWINGGFMVIDPQVFEFIQDDHTSFEIETLVDLTNQKMVSAYKHYGFWKCMDTANDRSQLEKLWSERIAPWKLWS